MAGRSYVPDRGDVVWLQVTPQAGHEQAGHRPALVLSLASYNRRSGLMLCCPITSRVKGYPFEVHWERDRNWQELSSPTRSRVLTGRPGRPARKGEPPRR
jgi:mRNA interferase MazF